jgi:hypothetical protein
MTAVPITTGTTTAGAMPSAKRDGQRVGLLLLVQLAAGLIVPYILLRPIQADFLAAAAGSAGLVRWCVLALFVGAAVTVAMAIATWPHVRARSPALGLWLLVLAVMNFTLQILENTHWLSMLSVSQAYAAADAAQAALFPPLASVVRAGWKWAHYSHILVAVAWLFTLYWVLWRGAMVPRVLAAIGMVTCLMQFVGITLPAFGGYRMPMPTLFGMPLGVANLMLAAWLLARGFHAPGEGRSVPATPEGVAT